jgi:hypothetical protein
MSINIELYQVLTHSELKIIKIMSSISKDIINEQFHWPENAEIDDELIGNIQNDAEMIDYLKLIIAEQKQLIAQQKYMIDRYQPIIEDNARLMRENTRLEKRLYSAVAKYYRQNCGQKQENDGDIIVIE